VFISLSLSLFSQGHHLVIANVGDSRAILATKDEIGGLKAIQLTVDLKPNLPSKKNFCQICLRLINQ
jgi:serine/threonine protein phosphatase PrpC